MSRKYRKKDKDLINLVALTADQVWTKDKSGKPKLRKDLDIYGRIDKGTSSLVTSTNLSGRNHRYVDDSCNLPKKVKHDVVKFLKNDNKKVVYLVHVDNEPEIGGKNGKIEQSH